MKPVDPATRPIVVGFDPQTLDRAPVHFGIAAARLTGSPLIVVSACAPAPVVDALPPANADDELTDLGVQAMSELKGEVHAGSVEVYYRERRGRSAPHVLHEEARRGGARLLVVGSTSRGVVGRVAPGSTAERLMHGAPCAVAVVPNGWDAHTSIATIGVAFAETDEGFAALRGAYGLAERSNASLRVLSVVRVRPSDYGEIEASGGFGRGGDLVDVEGEHRRTLETAMRNAVARLPGLASDVRVEIDAFVGDPADTLIGISENLDLLVCGSRGYGPLHAALLGGVSRRITAAAHCPVIVLARGVDAPLEPLLAADYLGAAG